MVVALSGCDNPAFIEFMHPGSQLAVESCIQRNSSTLVAAVQIRAACIDKHQHDVRAAGVTGTLRPDLTNSHGLALEIQLINNSTDKIVTNASITMTIARAGGPGLQLTGKLSPLFGEPIWLLPHDSGFTYAHYASQSDEQDWNVAKGLLTAGASWTWTLSASGLDLKLR